MAQKSICRTLLQIEDVAHLEINATGAANNYGYNANCPEKFQIIDVWARNYGGNATGACTMTLKDGDGTAITDALDVNKNDNIRTNCSTIDDAYATIAPGGTINAVLSDNTKASCKVYVTLLRVS